MAQVVQSQFPWREISGKHFALWPWHGPSACPPLNDDKGATGCSLKGSHRPLNLQGAGDRLLIVMPSYYLIYFNRYTSALLQHMVGSLLCCNDLLYLKSLSPDM